MTTLSRSVIVLALVAACFIPSAVWAQTPAGPPPPETKAVSAMPPNYFALKLGAYFPQDKWDVLDLGVFEYSLDTGFNGDLVFGHYFNRNWALEFGIGYFYTSGDDTLGTTRSKADMDVMPVTLAVKGIIPADKWEIYGIGGIGAYFVWADEKLNGIKFSDDDILFGGFLGAGVSYNITPQAFLGLEGKYLWTDKSSFSDAGWRAKQKLDGWITTFNIGFRF